MIRVSKLIFGIGAAAAMLGGGASAAQAMQQQTPTGFNYEIKNGQRVPKPGNRVTNPDGSWREETRNGKCITVREKTATGELKETNRCD
jgi:hypothetical protein